MVWNTIAHPRMMDGGFNPGGIIIPKPADDETTESSMPTEIKYCNAPKQAVFDFIIVGPGNPWNKDRLVLGDYNQVAKKLMNGEVVLGLYVMTTEEDRFYQETLLSMKARLTEYHHETVIHISFDSNISKYWHSDNTITDDSGK